MAFGLSAGAVSLIGMGAGALLGGSGGGSSQSGNATTTNTATRDPRMDAILYGDGSGTGANQGLLSQYQALGQQPQSAGSAAYGNAAQAYLQNGAQGDLANLHTAANGLMNSNYQAPQSQAAINNAVPQMTATINGSTPQSQAGQSTAAINNATPGMTAAQAGPATQVTAAQLGAPGAYAVGNQVQAPAQNSVNTAGAYDKIINGDAGANPYLTKALQSGVDQTNASYQANQQSLTDNLQRNVLSGIRSNSVLSGQYGGSRQGIAEGNAISDYTKQLTNSNLQLGLANSANTTGQQAAAYNSGQDRSLSALNTLSGQQYGVAQQDAATKNQAEFMNVGNTVANQQQQAGLQQGANLANQNALQQTSLAQLGVNQQTLTSNLGAALATAQGNQQAQNASNLSNAGLLSQSNIANAGLQQQTNLNNQNAQNAASTANLGSFITTAQGNQNAQQSTNLANASLQNQTNSLNSNNQQAGIGANSGLLNNQVAAANTQDAYALNHASQVNGLLAPYLGATGSTTTQPLYSNTAGNILGGATAGLGLAGQIKGLLGNGNGNGVGSSGSYAANDYLTS